jgi:hypothetical protein
MKVPSYAIYNVVPKMIATRVGSIKLYAMILALSKLVILEYPPSAGLAFVLFG